ncbi:MAG: hypothetical protein KatS3mg008_0392 [Acidimicrobiales bacterium]|nr:MAG: hypothetical protein KatS3mg008_0392 [Acidimicrobiales bacterium]
MSRADRVVLVGMPGVGKTTVARILARRLGARMYDTDRMVEEHCGTSVAQLIDTCGEERFRGLEEEMVSSALRAEAPCVISLGGGAVTSARTRESLSTGVTVVWLRARPDTICRRVGDDGVERPLLRGDLRRRVEDLDATRRPLYESVADLVVDVDDLDAEQAADQIVRHLFEGEVPGGGLGVGS